MSDPGTIRANYWAAARSAAGRESDELPVDAAITLTDLLGRLAALHDGSRLPTVLASCSVLIGDQPVSSQDADEVQVEPGATVEFLPPFAGG